MDDYKPLNFYLHVANKIGEDLGVGFKGQKGIPCIRYKLIENEMMTKFRTDKWMINPAIISRLGDVKVDK